MRVRLIFDEPKHNLVLENNVDSFKEISKVIAGTRWYGINNEIYVNTNKIVKIEVVEWKF